MFNLKTLISTFDRIMAAITFAEANEHEKALDILHDRPAEIKDERVDARITRPEETRPDLRM